MSENYEYEKFKLFERAVTALELLAGIKQTPYTLEKNQTASLTEADIADIPFYIKGMKPAPTDAEYKFPFSRDRNGEFYEYTKQLYRDINLYGSVKIGQYEFKIGGKDGNLISGKLVG